MHLKKYFDCKSTVRENMFINLISRYLSLVKKTNVKESSFVQVILLVFLITLDVKVESKHLTE